MTLFDLDAGAFAALHGNAQSPAVLVFLALLVAKAVIYLLPAHIGWLWLTGDGRARRTALSLVLALLIGLCASALTGWLAFRPRPFLADLGEPLMAHRGSAAFPSNHALIFFAYGTVLALLRHRRLAQTVLSMGLLVGLARVYLGVHYPLDILGGMAYGALAALAALWLVARWGEPLHHVCFAIDRRVFTALDGALARIEERGRRR